MNNPKYKNAFTLAEILIVLVIMSLISVLCIRSITDTRLKQESVVRLQKTYEDINKAVANGILENGSIEYWDFSLAPTEFFSTYLSTLKVVDTEKFSNIWRKKVPKYYEISGNEEKNYAIMQDPSNTDVLTLDNGVQIIIHDANSKFYTNGEDTGGIGMWIDTNGIKEPNTIGKDLFVLALTTDGTLIFPTWDDNQATSDAIGKTRADLMKEGNSPTYNYECNEKSRGYWCGAVIQKDGWKIKKDYPWK